MRSSRRARRTWPPTPAQPEPRQPQSRRSPSPASKTSYARDRAPVRSACKDSGPMPAPDIVDTPEEAAELELAPLIIREPLEAYLDSQGLGSGRVEAER